MVYVIEMTELCFDHIAGINFNWYVGQGKVSKNKFDSDSSNMNMRGIQNEVFPFNLHFIVLIDIFIIIFHNLESLIPVDLFFQIF